MPRWVRENTLALVMSCPLKKTLPPDGLSCPVSRLNRVVLPAPLGPMRAKRSPGSMPKRDALHRGEAAEMHRQVLGLKQRPRVTFLHSLEGSRAPAPCNGPCSRGWP